MLKWLPHSITRWKIADVITYTNSFLSLQYISEIGVGSSFLFLLIVTMFIFSGILPKILWVLSICLGVLYFYFKFVFYSYWKRKDVPYEEPCVPFGSIGKIIQGKDNLGK